MKIWQRCLFVLFALVAVWGGVAYAQAPSAPPVEFPYTGNRTAVWIVAQLHILFAGFILGAPIFVVISEWLGYRKQDPRYDRLAKEVTKVTVILYSMTALTGGLFIFVLLATYPQFTTWLINHFFLIFAVVYPLLFIGETIVLYMYFYTWDAWKGEKKARHIALGVLLNLIGSITLFVIDAPTSFMNTPVKAEGISPAEFLASASLLDKVFNYSWMPLNLHRLVGNVTFGSVGDEKFFRDSAPIECYVKSPTGRPPDAAATITAYCPPYSMNRMSASLEPITSASMISPVSIKTTSSACAGRWAAGRGAAVRDG